MPEDLIVDTDNLVTCSSRWDALAARFWSMVQTLPNLKDPEALGLTGPGSQLGKKFMEVYGPAADDFYASVGYLAKVMGQVGAGVLEMARILQRADDAAANTSQGLQNNLTESAPPSGAGVVPPPSGGAGRH